MLHAEYPTDVERDIFRAFNDLPDAWSGVFHALRTIGTTWALGLLVAAALIGRRWRLARDLVVAGASAWVIAHILGSWVAGDGLSSSFHAVTRVSGVSPHFPVERISLVVAVVATAYPYVTRPTRRLGVLFILALVVATLYLGTGLPDDVLGGIFLGLGVAAAVHLIFGSPGGRPTAAQVTAALAELGIEAIGVGLSRKQPSGSTRMFGKDEEGPLLIRVIGRDEADAQLFAKAYRFLAYKDSGPTLYLTRLQQVEHEAYATLLARDAGVNTNEVVVAGEAGPKAAILAERPIVGAPLAFYSGFILERRYGLRTAVGVGLTVAAIAGAALLAVDMELGLGVLAAFCLVSLVWMAFNSWALLFAIADAKWHRKNPAHIERAGFG